MAATVTVLVVLEEMGACPTCGTHFAAESHFKLNRLDDHKAFYCPNGHAQSFVGESEATRLGKQLEREKRLREAAEDLARVRAAETEKLRRSRQQLQGKMKALKGRVKNGVCPCCNRSFVQLARHMATKHPDYSKPDEGEHG